MFEFYQKVYGGTGLGEAAFPELCRRAEDALGRYERIYTVTGSDEARKLALCAMAECIDYFDAARSGQGGMRYASVGTVSVSGKGVYSAVDISPAAQERELMRCVRTYLTLCRGGGSL